MWYARGMLVVAGLIAAFVLIALFANPATRLCRWREDRQGAQSRWTCVHCGATVYGVRGKPPRTCHRSSP
jgi:hypothetical protein